MCPSRQPLPTSPTNDRQLRVEDILPTDLSDEQVLGLQHLIDINNESRFNLSPLMFLVALICIHYGEVRRNVQQAWVQLENDDRNRIIIGFFLIAPELEDIPLGDLLINELTNTLE